MALKIGAVPIGHVAAIVQHRLPPDQRVQNLTVGLKIGNNDIYTSKI